MRKFHSRLSRSALLLPIQEALARDSHEANASRSENHEQFKAIRRDRAFSRSPLGPGGDPSLPLRLRLSLQRLSVRQLIVGLGQWPER